MTTAAMVLERCVPEGDCLIWSGAVQSSGYGSVGAGVKGVTVLAHRLVYTTEVGSIPDGMTIDHLCLRKTCMNVAHMEVVSRSENSRRKIAQQTHCKRGHELSGDNVRLQRRGARVHRVCRECVRVQGAARKLRALLSGTDKAVAS